MLKFIFAFISLYAIFVVRVETCSCLMGPHPQNAYCRSNTVVKAFVESMDTSEPYVVTYTINITDVYKGDISTGISSVRTASSGAMCGVSLGVGEVYVLTEFGWLNHCDWNHDVSSRLMSTLEVNRNPYGDNCQCEIYPEWYEGNTKSCKVGYSPSSYDVCELGCNNTCTWK